MTPLSARWAAKLHRGHFRGSFIVVKSRPQPRLLGSIFMIVPRWHYIIENQRNPRKSVQEGIADGCWGLKILRLLWRRRRQYPEQWWPCHRIPQFYSIVTVQINVTNFVTLDALWAALLYPSRNSLTTVLGQHAHMKHVYFSCVLHKQVTTDLNSPVVTAT